MKRCWILKSKSKFEMTNFKRTFKELKDFKQTESKHSNFKRTVWIQLTSLISTILLKRPFKIY